MPDYPYPYGVPGKFRVETQPDYIQNAQDPESVLTAINDTMNAAEGSIAEQAAAYPEAVLNAEASDISDVELAADELQANSDLEAIKSKAESVDALLNMYRTYGKPGMAEKVGSALSALRVNPEVATAAGGLGPLGSLLAALGDVGAGIATGQKLSRTSNLPSAEEYKLAVLNAANKAKAASSAESKASRLANLRARAADDAQKDAMNAGLFKFDTKNLTYQATDPAKLQAFIPAATELRTQYYLGNLTAAELADKLKSLGTTKISSEDGGGGSNKTTYYVGPDGKEYTSAQLKDVFTKANKGKFDEGAYKSWSSGLKTITK